jgi:DNA-cytosine methyltransferase
MPWKAAVLNNGVIRHLDLFTGMGGFSLGLRLAGLQKRTVLYVEWEQYPQEIIRARIKDGFLDDAPIWGDISTLDGEQFRGVVDLITAGFPCQPHSVAGLKRGANDERNLWPETLRVISEVEPRYVILENVPGILSASTNDGTPAYGGTVVGELAQIGYGVHWQTIGADDVGAPHRRKRWWCIAVANTSPTGIWDKPRASGRGAGSQDVRQGDGTLGPVWPDTTGADAGLADSSSGRYGEPPEEVRTGRNAPEYGIRQLADSISTGISGGDKRGLSAPRTETGEQQDRQSATDQLGNRGEADDLADSRQQPSGAEGNRLDDGGEDAGAKARVGATERNGFADGDSPLADSDGTGSTSHTRDYGKERSISEAQRQPEHGASVLGGSGAELADSTSWGPRVETAVGEGWEGGPRSYKRGAELADFPAWPPSPSDTSGWEQVIRVRPDLAPALTKETESQFRRVADGRSHRVDELKALGNGLLPAVAAEFLRRIRI